MAKTGSQKICVICGDDCSAMARVRDSHGRYYHKSCHEEAAARQQKRREKKAKKQADARPEAGSARPAPAPMPRPVEIEAAEPEPAPAAFSTEPLVDPEDSAVGLEDDLRLAESGSMMPIEKDSRAVPKPTAPRKVDRPAAAVEDPYAIVEGPKKRKQNLAPKPPVVDAEAGGEDAGAGPDEFDPFAELANELDAAPPATEAIAPAAMAKPGKVRKPPKVKQAGRTTWPTIIGVIAMIIGGLELLGTAARAVFMLPEALGEGNIPGIGAAVFIVCIGAAIALWQFLGGLGVFRRESFGAVRLRRWAITMTILHATCGSILLGMASLMEQEGGEVAEVSAIAGRATAAVILGFGIWPLFVAIWLSRATIRSEFEGWD